VSNQANWLLAHGNYLTDDDIFQLGAHAESAASRRSVAFCPRTHHYFGHSQHPYAKMLSARVTVCLGTDSLASTPSLSVLDEMRFLHRRDPALGGAALLHMGTLAGAWALGREQETGSLTPGKFADLAVIRLPSRHSNDPHELLLDSAEPVMRTMVGGRFVFQLR
jgi:cytosine/adenosine deaminase-related metal-dependent hydrolase